jgi:hypothetical protein
MIVYHGTDLRSANKIQRELRLYGDGLFGPGICTTFSRALNFVCVKCARQTRKIGRVLVLEIDDAMWPLFERDNNPDAYTAKSLAFLDLSGKIKRILLPRDWDKAIEAERGNHLQQQNRTHAAQAS